jgi:hypothetical protein
LPPPDNLKAITEAQYIAKAATIRIAGSMRGTIRPFPWTAIKEPKAEGPTHARNARGYTTSKDGREKKKTPITPKTSAPKPRLYSTAIIRARPPLAPSARGGSEKLTNPNITVVTINTSNVVEGGGGVSP